MISYKFNFEAKDRRSRNLQKTYGDFDSKFKFVIVASKRARQLLGGAKPKVKSKSKSLIRIAQEEVREGLVDYEIVQKKKEEYTPGEKDFIGEEIEVEKEPVEGAEIEKKPKNKQEKGVKSKLRKKKAKTHRRK